MSTTLVQNSYTGSQSMRALPNVNKYSSSQSMKVLPKVNQKKSKATSDSADVFQNPSSSSVLNHELSGSRKNISASQVLPKVHHKKSKNVSDSVDVFQNAASLDILNKELSSSRKTAAVSPTPPSAGSKKNSFLQRTKTLSRRPPTQKLGQVCHRSIIYSDQL